MARVVGGAVGTGVAEVSSVEDGAGWTGNAGATVPDGGGSWAGGQTVVSIEVGQVCGAYAIFCVGVQSLSACAAEALGVY